MKEIFSGEFIEEKQVQVFLSPALEALRAKRFFRTIGLLRIHGGVVMKNQRLGRNRCFYFLINRDKVFVTPMVYKIFICL